MTKTLICLGGGVESVPMLRRVRELGYMAICLDYNLECPGRAEADQFVLASCYHGEFAVSALREAGAAPDGVMCCAVDAPLAAARIRRAFDLPGMRPEAAYLSASKYAQVDALREAGLPVPDFVMVRREQMNGWLATRDEIVRTLGLERRDDEIVVRQFKTGAPLFIVPEGLLVVKPVDSRGGRGVIRLLPGRVSTTHAMQAAADFSGVGAVLVEEWLEGPQLSTESVVERGRAVFTAIALRNYARLDEFEPYCIEDGFDEPYGDERLEVEISSLIERACRALDWYQHGGGTVKGDLVLTPNGLHIIELAARLSGGFFSSHGTPAAYGVDLVGAAARLAMGDGWDGAWSGKALHVSQRYVFPHPDDVGRRVVALPDTPPGVELSTWNVQTGDTINPVRCHPDRLGQCLAVGATADEAQARAERGVAEMYRNLVVE